MSGAAPEFSRLVPLARLGSEPFRQRIEATQDERERLARRFDLIAIGRLAATVTLHRQAGGTVLLDAAFEAELEQTCVVTLEPVPAGVSRSFSLIYGPVDEALSEIEVDVDDPVFEPLTADAIDIGEAVAQELSLALPEFPRDPDAEIDAAAGEPIDAGFGALAGLGKPAKD
jgi:uncharacterized metal-binding protein YceD (DUF177 family)